MGLNAVLQAELACQDKSKLSIPKHHSSNSRDKHYSEPVSVALVFHGLMHNTSKNNSGGQSAYWIWLLVRWSPHCLDNKVALSLPCHTTLLKAHIPQTPATFQRNIRTLKKHLVKSVLREAHIFNKW